MTRPLVIYHKNCLSKDGFASAFAAWLKLRDTADYLAADFGDALPDVTGRDVYILDLSFDPVTLDVLGRGASSITLLDHHLSARTQLAGYVLQCCGKLHFDLEQCGCVLAWKHFHPGRPVPPLFRWIQDRDLWQWRQTDSKAFLAWLDAQPLSFEGWEVILSFSPEELRAHIREGETLAAQYDGLCRSIAAKASTVTIGPYRGLMVNASGEFRSEVGALMAAESGTFGLVWRVSEVGTVLCSLRSVESFDVEVLAVALGGRGHPNSASFTLPLEQLMALVHGHIPLPLPAGTTHS